MRRIVKNLAFWTAVYAMWVLIAYLYFRHAALPQS